MKRSTRADAAAETVDIAKRGHYTSAGGKHVDLAAEIRDCLEHTRLLDVGEVRSLRRRVPTPTTTTRLDVVNETTLQGIDRLLAESPGPVAALNFASARNPGGGFLNGSQAQEESLARSSALYLSQLRAWDFYQRHRDDPSLFYSDAIIVSPDCPVFRDDEGMLLDEPRLVTFLTCAAPNAGAAERGGRDDLDTLPDVFRRRSEGVLAAAASFGIGRLVLGAWGCGVFRNDPAVVASSFAEHLRGTWSNVFERVTFSVLDRSADGATFNAFATALR